MTDGKLDLILPFKISVGRFMH